MALLVVVKGEPRLKYLTEARLTELRRGEYIEQVWNTPIIL
ncbi:MAG: hypothetical protein JW384_03689 [Nitrosomonadaceae bacterium]|nr:hypothetical protein [Nitrosomonadaceae bacterium]